MGKNKLLLVGSGSIHLFNYFSLIEDYFQSKCIITNNDNYKFNDSEVIIENFGLKNPFYIIKTISTIRRKIEQFKPDIIHIHQANSFSFLTLLAAYGTKIPTVVTAWGDDVLVNPYKNIFLKLITKFCLKRADAITSDSLYMTSQIRKLIELGDKKLITVNFGVNIPNNLTTKENIIYSNRLHHDFYRIDKIILAFDKFYKSNSNWKLIIAGSGDETKMLIKLTESLQCTDAIKFVGWVGKDENNLYYSKARFFVSIPSTDATSVSLLESMSYNCIPIVSNLPANTEWVLDTVNGIVVDNTEDDFFSKALLLDEKICNEINKNLIIKKASKSISKEKFVKLYDQLLK